MGTNERQGTSEIERKRAKAKKEIAHGMRNMRSSYIESAIYNEEEMKSIFDGIAKNILNQMYSNNMSLNDLGMSSGVCISHLSRIANAKTRIGLDALIRIAAVFEMSPAEFFPHDRMRMTRGDKFDEMTRFMDSKSSDFMLDMCAAYCREWNRMRLELR